MKTSILNLIVSAAAVAMIAMPIPALAEATEAQIDRFVSMYDFNKDGKISRAEIMKRSSDMLDKMNKDKNGMVDDKKAMAFLLELQMGDGAPSGYMASKSEMLKKIGDMFDKLDTTKKGVLDKKQAEALLNELMKSGA